MKRKIFLVLMVLVASIHWSPLLSQSLPYGMYHAGFKTLALRYNDTTVLNVSLYYPSMDTSGARIPLLDFSHNYTPEPMDSAAIAEMENDMRRFIDKNFGAIEDAYWQSLKKQVSNTLQNASHPTKRFPLILGRLRVFSTHFTCEYLASHGFVVAMLKGVEDHPPSDRASYYRQINREIEYYDFISIHLHTNLKIVNNDRGLMGFSGGGFSQFFAPMRSRNYKAVTLIESGVFLDGDLFDIVSGHPSYAPLKFTTPLLFLYNKGRFEANRSSENFWKLKTPDKFLVLFDDPAQHHWDFATEGFVASSILTNREPGVSEKQKESFVAMNELVLRFFEIYLKNKRTNFRSMKMEGIIIK